MKREATLLIVDDEAEVREVLVEYFAAQGYAALGAGNAAAARASAAARGIDLALVDVHMPGEDGLSLARHLRERYSGIAIVMLTSASRPARDAGAKENRARPGASPLHQDDPKRGLHLHPERRVSHP